MSYQYVNHVVGAVEDLFFLAEYFYGQADLWWVIYHANLEEIGDDPEDLESGTTLRIPLLETAKETVEMPAVIPATTFEHAQDSLVQFCRDRYGDPHFVFDVYETSEKTCDERIDPGTEINLPARGKPQNLRKAQLWRGFFRRRWVNPLEEL